MKGITKPRPPPPPPPLPPAPTRPGRKIDVGGYGLYLECAGSGSPTVILEAGLGAPSATLDRAGIPIPGLAEGWRAARAALASETRVCAYDRAGLGASDRRPSRLVPSATTYASELRTLLTNANVPGPYVLYGARFGGLLVLSYAAHWPNPTEIAGVVFSEAYTPCPSACPYDFPPEHAVLDGLAGVHLGARPVVVLTSEGATDPPLRSAPRTACGSALPTFPPRRHNSRSKHCVSSWPPPGRQCTYRPATKRRCPTPAGGANRSADLSPPLQHSFPLPPPVFVSVASGRCPRRHHPDHTYHTGPAGSDTPSPRTSRGRPRRGDP